MKKIVKSMFMIILVIGLCGIGSVAVAAPAPTGVRISKTSATINLAEGSTLQLDADVLPSTASQRLQWKSGNTSIAKVSSTGLVTAMKPGTVYIYVRPYGVNKIGRCALTVKNGTQPTSIAITPTSLTLSLQEEKALTAKVYPTTADQRVQWQVKDSSIAKVTSTGVVKGLKAGKTMVRAISTVNKNVYKIINVTVEKQAAPTSITITPDTREMQVGDKLTLSATPVPAAAGAAVSWMSSDTDIATVSSAGVVMAKKVGTVKIAAVSKLKTSVRTIRTLTIVDPNNVTGVKITQSDIYLAVGDTGTLTAKVLPEGAKSALTWKSSNSAVVSVNSAGKITAKAKGTAVITVKTDVGGFTATVNVAVLDTNRTTELPDRTGSPSDIKNNLAKMDAIRISANNEIVSLQAQKQITSADALRRKKAIENAFAMYRFPWMTEKTQNYWSSSLESKAFQPNIIYFGMPYIQCGANGNYSNRRFNAALAIASGYFDKVSSGYYMMDQSRKLSGMYVGNDCSSFVSMSIWGTGHTASYLNTTAMNTSPYYKTISGSNNIRPGDVLVKSGVHTVMFLYYTNTAKTQMMIIEQGGGTEPNTVACRVKNVASYVSNGYAIKRPVVYG